MPAQQDQFTRTNYGQDEPLPHVNDQKASANPDKQDALRQPHHSFSSNSNHEPAHKANASTNSPVAAVVRNVVLSVTGWNFVGDDDSFFNNGLDSRQALQITRALRRGLSCPTLSLSLVYKNPTIKQLSEMLAGPGCSSQALGSDHLLNSLQSTYTSLVKSIPVPIGEKKTLKKPLNVALTGSTGYLGTYILQSLLNSPDVGHIFCLNRGEDGGKAIQAKRFGNDANKLDEKRVTFLKTDLACPKLGLDEDIYQNLTHRISVIIHNAWPVNFILELQAFRPQLEGVLNLCSLAASLLHQPAKIIFASSVSAVFSNHDGKNTPESIIDIPPATNQGYGQSKFISEHILDGAAKHLGICAIVVRIGQVAGPVHRKGLWNPTEWFPSLITSSVHLGCLPDSLGAMGMIDWVPSDVLGQVIVDITTSAKKSEIKGSGAQVFNLRNPKITSWGELVPTVQQAARELPKKELELVLPAVWLERLQKSLADLNLNGKGDMNKLAAAAARNPAIKLLDFYMHILWVEEIKTSQMDIGHANDLSPALQSLPAVHSTWMRKWMEEWAGIE